MLDSLMNSAEMSVGSKGDLFIYFIALVFWTPMTEGEI